MASEPSDSPLSPSPQSKNRDSKEHATGFWGSTRQSLIVLRNRVISGLFLALPLVVTAMVIKWGYDVLASTLIEPLARLVLSWWNQNPVVTIPDWVATILAPIVAIAMILAILFLLGMLFRSRVHRLVDWIVLQVPGVRTIYSSVLKVIDAFQRNQGAPQFQRVVLVEFPHPGMKVPGFVMSSCIDRSTQETILCIYCPTTPVPTSGYMLLVPEKSVQDLDWDVQETIQAIVSGGITVPQSVDYYRVSTKTIAS